MRTVRIVIVSLALLVSALALPAIAAAHPDYRPWKAALQRAFTVYSNREYDEVWPGLDCDYDTGAGIAIPLMFDQRKNNWDWDTQVTATVVTALWGVLPNSEFGPDMREFLRPFLRRHPLRSELPVPWLSACISAHRAGVSPIWATP